MIDRNRSGQLPKNNEHESELSFYWQSYGFNEDPFPAVTDVATYFPLPQWEHHLDLVQYLIKNENVLLAVIGVEGQGKTTFATQVSQLFNEGFQIHKLAADSLFSARKLVHELEVAFNLKTLSGASLEEQLDSQIAEVQHKENTCVVIIDDAHFLPLETINSLIFLLKQQSKNQMRLHIILFGDKNLQLKLINLSKHEMNNHIIHTIELAPLTLEETKEYLSFRLNKGGLDKKIPFSEMEIEKIYANSNGIPGKINYLAQQILLNNLLTEQQDMVVPSMFKRHQTKIIGGCLLVIVLIMASYVLDRQGQTLSPTTQRAVISFSDQSQTVVPPIQQSSTQSTVTNNPQNSNAGNSELTSGNPNVSSNTADNTASNTVGEDTQQAVPATDANQNNVNAQQTNDASTLPTIAPSQQTASSQNVQPQKNAQISEVPLVAPESKALKSTMSAESQTIQTKSKLKSIHATAANTHKIAGQNQTNASTATLLKFKSMRLNKSEENLIATHGKYYTLQVLGLSKENLMLKFIEQNHLQGHTHYIKTTLDGKPWFILVYGVYKTEQEAIMATHYLPSVLKKYQPWPRTLASVKIDIAKG